MIATVIYNNPMTEWWFESGAAKWFYTILGAIVGIIIFMCIIVWLAGCWEDWRNSRKK